MFGENAERDTRAAHGKAFQDVDVSTTVATFCDIETDSAMARRSGERHQTFDLEKVCQVFLSLNQLRESELATFLLPPRGDLER
jgi:hypothetical protein